MRPGRPHGPPRAPRRHGPPLNYYVPGLRVCLGGVTLPTTGTWCAVRGARPPAEWAVRRWLRVYPRRVPRDVPIHGESIRLGQLLKLAGVVGGGGEGKALVAEGAVRVNGEAEARRGRQLRPGDVVEAAGERLRVTAA